jgi:hypothetical protein
MLANNSNGTIMDAVAVTGTTVYTSTAIPLDGLKNCSISFVSTSTATGTAKLQGSVDDSVYIDLPNSGETVNKSVTAASSHMWNLSNLGYRSIKVVYTNATNSGTVTAKFFAKS